METSWVVKAQVHAGGRGKAGGVKLVSSKKKSVTLLKIGWVKIWLRTKLTKKVSLSARSWLKPVQISKKNCTWVPSVDRSSRRIVFMASTEGGVDIEKVAEETPEKIIKMAIDPLVGAQPFQAP